jgi:methionyl-tRNA formyltransferase
MVKVVFFGTPAFAVPSLEGMLAAGHDVAAVVTQPDRRRGRGQRTSPSPVKTAAAAANLAVLQPQRMRDPTFLAAMSQAAPTIGVVAAYGRILPDEVLSIPALGTINVHASLLPRYRGAAPIHRAVMAGDTETGITMIRLVSEMDAGPMLARATHPIGPSDTSEELEHALADLGATLLIETLRAFEQDRVLEKEQDHVLATFAPRLTREDGRIDWARPAQRLHDQVRGLHPWPHAATYLGDSRLLILRTRVLDCPGEGRAPGEILEARGDRLVVQCGDDTSLAITRLQSEGRAGMETRAFLSGHPGRLNARLTLAPTTS